MPTFKLSNASLEELRYKLSILVGEPDLMDDYSITEEHAEAFLKRMMGQRPGLVEVDDTEAAIVSGELENAAEIELSNGRFMSDSAAKARGYRLLAAAKPIN